MSVIVRPELNPGVKPVFGSGYRLNPWHPLNQGLVAWWLMNEGAGGNLNSVIKTPTTTITAPVWSAGELIFNDSTTYARTTFSNSITDIHTLSAWVYPTAWSAGNPQFIIQFADGVELFAALNISYHQIAVYGSSFVFGPTIPLNAWTHIAVTRNSTASNGYKIYFNGQLVGTTTRSYGGENGATCSLGFRGSAGGWIGMIRNAIVYQRVLSDADVFSLYAYPYGTPDNPRLLFPSTKRYFVPVAGGAGLYTKTGSAISPFTGSGSDALILTETGAGQSIFTGSGPKNMIYAESGTPISIFTGSGAKALIYSESGNGISIFMGSGSRAVSVNRTGAGISIFLGSGTEVYLSGNLVPAVSFVGPVPLFTLSGSPIGGVI